MAGNLNTNALSVVKTYEVDGETVQLSPSVVVRMLLNGDNNDLPNSELYKFVSICAARKLNPFTGDVHLVPRGGKATVIVSKDCFTKRAQRNPRFKGMVAGVTVINREGTIERRPGSMVGGRTEKLIGGWAKVYIDGWEHPAYEEVSLDEYNAGTPLWRTKPATMIRKVALVHALREAFPDEFGGLYDSSEMGVEVPESAPAGVLEPEPVPVEVYAETAQEATENRAERF